MASIFTFQSDPPRVSSPWSTPRASTPAPITKLDAEPQEGPTEYKLHLLLRKRRDYRSSSTSFHVSGSYRSVSASPKPKEVSASLGDKSVPLQSKSSHTRQQRLEQLTTQLLWRLQQSCPHHSTSANKQITPVFPQVGALSSVVEVGPLVPGLEESLGALYEIGVADDGTFVGLVEDEMNESLQNLRAMAASLGCTVNILRRVQVGTCEYDENSGIESSRSLRTENLWVVEAYVKPSVASARSNGVEMEAAAVKPLADDSNLAQMPNSTELRISLTGATMSGKSTLLGSLTTGALDNGRGKSRLNLLKHRHEIASGMTSSVTQELLGYTEEIDGTVKVVNYATDSVSSWGDIHSACARGRIVLLSDSAGHPRYRRTTLRGIIGWAPDWTLLCIPADNAEDTSGLLGSTPPAEEVLGVSSVDVDLSQAHLDLCLKLDLRMVVVITKLDLASKAGLRQTLAKLLSTLKAAGRTPTILANSSSSSEDLMSIPAAVYASCGETASLLNDDSIVPIVLTSTVRGTNVATLHALLCQLPLPSLPVLRSRNPANLFHIEDTYTVKTHSDQQRDLPVLSGILIRGILSVGDEVWLGPFTFDLMPDQKARPDINEQRPNIPTSRSFPGALNHAKGLPSRVAISEDEWIQVKVTSLRHLRLPVSRLLANQVGTVGTCLVNTLTLPPATSRIRKGMVIAQGLPTAKKGFVAEFARSDVDGLSIGMSVVVYAASIRASAKVVAGAVPEDEQMSSSIESLEHMTTEDEDDFAFGFDADVDATSHRSIIREKEEKVPRLLVTFQFLATKEYLEEGSQVLIMPGGGPGLYGGNERGEKGYAGLDGFVGRIMTIY